MIPIVLEQCRALPFASQDPAIIGQAAAAPLPPSGSVIGDSRIYSGPRRYGWRRHAYPEPQPAAAQSAQGSAARLSRWRGWRRASRGDSVQATAGDPEDDSEDASPAGQRPPVVAVPALVDGVPSDGANGSHSSGGADASGSPADLEAGDVQLMAWRTAAEGGGSADALPDAESAAPHHSHLQRLHLQRITSEAGAAGSDSCVRIGQDVSVGENVHIGIDVPEAVSDIEAPRERVGRS